MNFRWNCLVILAFILAIVIRISLLDHITNDYVYYLEPWYNYIQTKGGFLALKDNFSNYTPPYLYLLTLIVTFSSHLPKVVGIKLITFLFEFICACFAYQLVKLKELERVSLSEKSILPIKAENPFKSPLPLLAFFSVLFAPTLILNGSYWGQCDVIYTTALIACLYGLCRKQENFALVAFSVALAFKQQAMFLFPLLIILALKKYLSLISFLWIPLIYVVAILPAWVIGRSFKELIMIYFYQANTFKNLTLNAPTFYQWIPNEFYTLMAPLGMLLTVVIVVLFILTLNKLKWTITPNIIIQLALISVLLIPYCLPKMHDRYFFAADIISILYGFYFPHYFFVPIAINLVSLMSYLPFLLGQVIIPLNVLSLVLGFIILVLFYHLQETINSES